MLISVIVPIYKVEQYLERCVDSILNQTFTDFELVLVDDGSPDNCGVICDEYAKKDERIVVIHKENGGLSDARNAGIEWALKNSDSEWITFIDSDDWVNENYLKFLYTVANDNNVDISVCGFFRTNTEEICLKKINTNFKSQLLHPDELYLENALNATVAWGKLYKKNLWSSIRFPYGKIHEDEFTTYKILFAQQTLGFIGCELYFYFVNPESITGDNFSIRHLVMLMALEEEMFFFDTHKYENALKAKVEYYFVALNNFFKAFNTNKKIYHSEIKHIRKKMRKYLKIYGKRFCITANNHIWYYEIAYPKSINLYWIVKSKIRSKNK